MLGLITHWVLRFKSVNQTIKSIKNQEIGSFLSKLMVFLDKIYDPILSLIRKKIKPVIKLDDGRELNFSPLLFFLFLTILSKFLF